MRFATNLIALGQFTQITALANLAEALGLNPQPLEAHAKAPDPLRLQLATDRKSPPPNSPRTRP